MAENNTPNTSAATPSAAGAKNKFVVPAVVCIVLLAILLAFFFGSVSLYRDAAKSGVPEAQFTYGMHYKYGLGVKRDVFEAWNWWRKAAPKVNPAQKKLVKSVGEVEKAAKADNADARVQLVWSACLANGWGVEKDLAEAWKWQEKAVESAEKQTPHNQYEVALTCSVIPSYFGEVEPEKAAQLADAAFSLFKKAANEDYADAQCELAKCYLEGKGVEKNEKTAAEWFLKAAEKGQVEAEFQFALACEKGIGVEKDLENAIKWYRKAAGHGHAAARINLKVAKLLLKAQNGDAKAQYALGSIYDEGVDVKKDLKEAVKWYTKAAEQGHAVAQYCLGKYYIFGNDAIERDPVKAVSLLYKAADQGYVPAQNFLGECYQTGMGGVQKDLKDAVKWYTKAAEQGYAEAQYQLGKIYLSGEDGVEKDEKAGKKWMKKAAKQGHKQAKRFLDN